MPFIGVVSLKRFAVIQIYQLWSFLFQIKVLDESVEVQISVDYPNLYQE